MHVLCFEQAILLNSLLLCCYVVVRIQSSFLSEVSNKCKETSCKQITRRSKHTSA